MHNHAPGAFVRYLIGLMLACVMVLPVAAQDWVYSARAGDNLWNLAEEYLVQGAALTARLQSHNAIVDPTHIRPGTRIRFPIRWLKQQPAAARLVRRSGDVQLLAAGSAQARPVAEGAALTIGDRLETGVESAATVQFADGSRTLVQAQSALTFDSMTAYHTTGMVDTTLRLHRGRVENDVEKAKGPGSRFRIITPAAVAAVRGTDFRIGFRDSDSTMLSEVTGGNVGVRGENVTRALAAGFGLLAKSGMPPERPRALLVAPDLAAAPALAERLLLELAWPQVPGAAGYRAQLYAAADREALLLDKVVSAARVEWDAPADGAYVLLVRAIDADGLEGLSAEHAFVLNARPVPPALLRPAAQAKIYGPQQTLRWAQTQDSASYHLQVARDEAFGDRVIDAEGLHDTTFILDPELAPAADYWWRIAIVNLAGEKGPFGDARALRVIVVPAALDAASSTLDADGVTIGWGRAANAARYELQLARDAEFSDLVREELIDGTEFKLANPDPGTFYFRARGVSDEDARGVWSPVNQFEIAAPPWDPLMLLLFAPLLLL